MVTATDDGSPVRISTATLTIVVDDENDNQPYWLSALYDVSISEDLARDSLVIETRATDLDTGVNADLTYAIESGGGNKFTLDSVTGDITLRHLVDRESDDYYGLVITVADGGTPPHTVSTSVSISILDINDNAPIFTDIFSFTTDENVARETLVGQVIANDPDLGSNGVVNYFIHDVRVGETGHFVIGQTSGIVETVVLTLDREVTDQYILRVRAEDQGVPIMTSYTDVTIDIADLNDNTPYFAQSSYTATLEENAGAGVELFIVEAADPDLNENADLNITIPDRPESLYFIVNETSTYLTTIGSIDREVYPYIFFYMYAADMGNTSLVGRASVNITVLDLNDNWPQLGSHFYKSVTS